MFNYLFVILYPLHARFLAPNPHTHETAPHVGSNPTSLRSLSTLRLATMRQRINNATAWHCKKPPRVLLVGFTRKREVGITFVCCSLILLVFEYYMNHIQILCTTNTHTPSRYTRKMRSHYHFMWKTYCVCCCWMCCALHTSQVWSFNHDARTRAKACGYFQSLPHTHRDVSVCVCSNN